MDSDNPAVRAQIMRIIAAAVLKKITCPQNLLRFAGTASPAQQNNRFESAQRDQLAAERSAAKFRCAACVDARNQRNAGECRRPHGRQIVLAELVAENIFR